MPYKDPAKARASTRKRFLDNPEAVRAANRISYARYRAKRQLAHAAWRAANMDKVRAYGRFHARQQRLRKYGITEEQYQQLMKNPRCEICGSTVPRSKKGWSLDHKHGGKFRGLLCQPHNLMLGHAEDKIDILQAAIVYLETHHG